MKTIYFATGNDHKLKLAKETLTSFNVEGIELDLPEFQGDHVFIS